MSNALYPSLTSQQAAAAPSAAVPISWVPRMLGSGDGGFSESPTYGFDNFASMAFEGAPRFFVLGKHRIAPALISSFTEQSGDTQTLKLIYFCGTGGQYGIESITNIQLNEQPLNSYSGVTTYTRGGTSDQTAIGGFNKVSTPHDVGASVETDEYQYTTRANVDEIALVFAWQGGLYSTGTGGNVANETWRATIQWQDTAVGGNRWSTKTVSVTAKTRAVHRDVISLDFKGTITNFKTGARTGELVPLADGSYGYATGPAQYKIRVKAVTSAGATSSQRATLQRVEERVHETETYAGSALLGIKAVAQESLEGGLPVVTCDVKGWKVKATGGSTARWSQNPAELLRAVIVDPTDGLGKWITDADLDLTGTWTTASSYMDDQVKRNAFRGDTVKEARHHLDLVVDSIQGGTDWLSHMLLTCRGSLVEFEGQLGLTVDKASSSVRAFVAGTGSGSKFLALPDGSPDFREIELDSSDRATHLKVAYWDEGSNYDRRYTEEYVGSEYVSTDPPVRQELFLPGVTRQSQAKREARYHLNRARFLTTIYEWGVGPQALDLLPGDTVTVNLDSPNLAVKPCKILAVSRNENGTGRIVAAIYNASVYTDNTDTLPSPPAFMTRSAALQHRRQFPRGATSVTIKDVTR